MRPGDLKFETWESHVWDLRISSVRPGDLKRETWGSQAWDLGISIVRPGNLKSETWESQAWDLRISSMRPGDLKRETWGSREDALLRGWVALLCLAELSCTASLWLAELNCVALLNWGALLSRTALAELICWADLLSFLWIVDLEFLRAFIGWKVFSLVHSENRARADLRVSLVDAYTFLQA